jgi:predicted DCC family thiol-disulfide oxidoreductase YuxK
VIKASLLDQDAQAVDTKAIPGLCVWYDGACPLCLREIALMQRWDSDQRIAFVDLADPMKACPLDRGLMLERLHARENGIMLDGAAAFAAMWRAIPRLRWLGELARRRAILWCLERLYRGFLRMRPALQGMVR